MEAGSMPRTSGVAGSATCQARPRAPAGGAAPPPWCGAGAADEAPFVYSSVMLRRGVRHTPRPPRQIQGPPMSRTLAVARQEFVAAIKRDTPGPDGPRLVAVLDALIAWSVARPALLAFRA